LVSQDKNAQLLVLAINQVLASEGLVLLVKTNKKGSNEKLLTLVKDMKAGAIL
jgi:molybdopterin-containing oxidoreductase family iron-sulfur binding subunit